MNERPFGTEYVPASQLLIVRGSVDEVAVDDLREALQEATNNWAQDVTVDLSDVDFLPSLAIGVLIGAMNKNTGRVMLVSRSGTIASRVLKICCIPCGLPA